MTTPIPFASITAISPVVDYLQNKGFSPEKQMRTLGISVEMEERGLGKIAKAQVYHFLESCKKETGLEDLGYRFGRRYFAEGMDPLRVPILQSCTLKEAIAVFGNLLSQWMGDNHVWIETREGISWICNASSDGLNLPRDLSNQCALLVMMDLIREVAGKNWKPEQVKLESRPGSIHLQIPELEGVSVDYHPRVTAVAFPSEFLGRRLPCAGSSQDRTRWPATPTVSTVLEQLLQVSIRDRRLPALPEAAYLLGISERSLQRKLWEQGASFRQVLERVRMRQAMDYLEETNYRVSDISKMLGYSGANNFIRAFSRFTDQTPVEWQNVRRASGPVR